MRCETNAEKPAIPHYDANRCRCQNATRNGSEVIKSEIASHLPSSVAPELSEKVGAFPVRAVLSGVLFGNFNTSQSSPKQAASGALQSYAMLTFSKPSHNA
jgi:hypothetical protein